jgi:hypothetical protein
MGQPVSPLSRWHRNLDKMSSSKNQPGAGGRTGGGKPWRKSTPDGYTLHKHDSPGICGAACRGSAHLGGRMNESGVKMD